MISHFLLLAPCLVSYLVSYLVCCLVSYLVYYLVCCLVSYLVYYLVCHKYAFNDPKTHY